MNVNNAYVFSQTFYLFLTKTLTPILNPFKS